MPARDFAWIDFANVPGLLDWIGFGLGTLGIGFTVIQLLRSRGALKAAAKALIETRASLIKNQLVARLPALQEISHSVDKAVKDDDRDSAQLALEQFCNYANESAELLKSFAKAGGFEPVIAELLEVSDKAGEARAGLFDNPGMTVAEIIAGTASEVRNLSSRMVGTTTAVKNDPGRTAVA